VAGNGVMILAEKKIFILAGKYIAGYKYRGKYNQPSFISKDHWARVAFSM
jgi:hypothetical protein